MPGFDAISDGAGRLRIAAKLARNVYRKHGLVAMVQLAWHELSFDILHGTSTAIDAGKRYESSNPVLFRRLIARLPDEARSGTFLDCGAGKGRALILAARHGFRRSLGVEILPDYCAEAERNIAIYLARQPGCSISVRNEDAAGMKIPDDVSVIYLYNPFGADMIEAVIDRLQESLRRAPRPVWAVYLAAIHGDMFLRRGFRSAFKLADVGEIFHWTADGHHPDLIR